MKVLVVDDEKNIRESIRRLLGLEGIESAAASNGAEAVELLKAETFDAIVTDLRMPVMGGQELLERIRDEGLRSPVIMISALGEINDAVKALKTGAVDYLIKPFDPDELIYKIRAAVSNKRREDLIEAGARTAAPGSRFVGEGEAARALRRALEKIAPTDTTVLITGESGAGKEIVAREIHARSPRAEEPFVAVNIGAVHENLMESELFGHEKGAFTGADARKVGLFELAGSGSLFLDEIGEMPLPLQVKLLRVVQERKIRRVGGTRDIPVGTRILSASNRDIEAMVREGRFREDLYYRLNVVRVVVPPLRDRKDDIPLLAGFILEKLRGRMGKAGARLGQAAMDALISYSFPGNVRELENILERALIYGEGDEILAADLDFAEGRHEMPGTPAEPKAPVQASPSTSLDSVEHEAIERTLAKWDGNRTKAAEELGISRRTVINKIKRYGLE
ncbi:MAG: sigma-54 dependent transcriptional regulator [Rectinemataceae bacterium]|jgi:two-component system response regulator AtoC